MEDKKKLLSNSVNRNGTATGFTLYNKNECLLNLFFIIMIGFTSFPAENRGVFTDKHFRNIINSITAADLRKGTSQKGAALAAPRKKCSRNYTLPVPFYSFLWHIESNDKQKKTEGEKNHHE